MDLAQWYAAGRWVALLELVDMLPAACRLNEAIANDPTVARELAALPAPSEPWAPKVSEFNLTVVLLRDILGTLSAIKQGQIVAAGGRPKPQKPFPVPRTEIDRVKAEMEREFVMDIGGLLGFDPSDLQ